MQLSRARANRFFAVVLDGYPNIGQVKSVEGGKISADVVTQPIGGHAMRVKNVGSLQIEPFTVQVPLSVSDACWDWVAKSWSGQVERRNGAILTFDETRNLVHEQQFTDALILEATIPALDASGKEPAIMSVKFQAEQSKHITKPPTSNESLPQPTVQKIWTTQNFRLDIDGQKQEGISKIEAFTLKQNVKPVAVGAQRVYQLEPTSLEYPNLTITMPLSNAGAFFSWHEEFVVQGKNSAKKEKTGAITLLDPTRSKDLLTVNLAGVGIASITVDKGDAAGAAIKMVKIELYVERMELK